MNRCCILLYFPFIFIIFTCSRVKFTGMKAAAGSGAVPPAAPRWRPCSGAGGAQRPESGGGAPCSGTAPAWRTACAAGGARPAPGGSTPQLRCASRRVLLRSGFPGARGSALCRWLKGIPGWAAPGAGRACPLPAHGGSAARQAGASLSWGSLSTASAAAPTVGLVPSRPAAAARSGARVMVERQRGWKGPAGDRRGERLEPQGSVL